MKCPNCDTANDSDARFCSDCAAPLSSRPDAQASAPEVGPPPAATGPPPGVMVGRTVDGKYRIVERIAAGGMGTVYRATRLLIGDEVAVKVLHPEHVADTGAAERFRREAQAAARLKHPNAVSIYDFGVTEDGLVYLVMELVGGESLRRIIRERGPLTPSASGEVMRQVCSALDEAHRHGVVHRDLKPDNVIVETTTQGLRVKVLDFGIAKLRDTTASNLTQTGSVMGTPHYMSPEQCVGEELDSRSDIYSLGVVLFEMLCGTVPFNSPTSTAVVIQHVTQPPPSLRAVNMSIPEAVERVVRHALEKRREDRPQSAGALAAELDAAVGVFGTSPVSVMTAVHVPAPAPAAPLTHSGEVSTVVMNSSAQTSSGMRPSITPSLAENKNKSVPLLLGIAVLFTLLGGIGVWLLTKDDGSRTRAEAVSKAENKNSQVPTNATPPSENTAYALTGRPRTTPTPTKENPTTIGEVEAQQFIQAWRQAWESKDLHTYVAYYDANFVGRNYSSNRGYTSMSRAHWLKDKEQKFRRSSDISVGVGQLTVKINDGDTVVSFTQTFRSAAYSDKGFKTLYLRRTQGGNIKIVREDFTPQE